jgi:glutamine synthetase
LEHPIAGSVKLVPGAHNLAGLHERAIPQKDQLCGPFWGALTLTAAGHPTDQDEVVRSWVSKDLLDCYIGVKRTEISLLEGAKSEEACERYLRVY